MDAFNKEQQSWRVPEVKQKTKQVRNTATWYISYFPRASMGNKTGISVIIALLCSSPHLK